MRELEPLLLHMLLKSYSYTGGRSGKVDNTQIRKVECDWTLKIKGTNEEQSLESRYGDAMITPRLRVTVNKVET